MAKATAPQSAEAEADLALDDDVRNSILQNPQAILNDAELMRALLAPAHDAGRNVVDLRAAMIARLEEQLGRLAEAHRDVVAAAWDNMSGMEQVHRAVLAVLDAASFEDFVEVVSTDFSELLSVDFVRFCMSTDAPQAAKDLLDNAPASPIVVLGFDAFSALSPATTMKRSDLGGPVALMGDLAPGEADPAIFGADAAHVRSLALIALDFGPAIQPGLVAFGSREPSRFSCEQGTDLLCFLGAVVERAMRDWLALGR